MAMGHGWCMEWTADSFEGAEIILIWFGFLPVSRSQYHPFDHHLHHIIIITFGGNDSNFAMQKITSSLRQSTSISHTRFQTQKLFLNYHQTDMWKVSSDCCQSVKWLQPRYGWRFSHRELWRRANVCSFVVKVSAISIAIHWWFEKWNVPFEHSTYNFSISTHSMYSHFVWVWFDYLVCCWRRPTVEWSDRM